MNLARAYMKNIYRHLKIHNAHNHQNDEATVAFCCSTDYFTVDTIKDNS